MKSVQEQLKAIKRGVVEILSEEELKARLTKSFETNKPLRIKLGIDPTASDVHLGFTVPLRKLKTFQELGHRVVIIIGNYTAMVGDPSGKNATRPQLSHEAVMANAKYYKEQIFKILDEKTTEVVYNGDWFSKFSFNDVIALASKITVAGLLEHDYFQNRYRNGIPISLHEFIYPLMQGWDSVEVKADVEMGGTDQRFNIIVGRSLQKENGQEPQVALFMPILLGTDGKTKMSKSFGNYIGISENPKDMFGKLMSIPDELMESYFELLTSVPLEELAALKEGLKNGSLHPRSAKVSLAKEIVGMYHGKDAAEKEAAEFDRVFADKKLPSDIPELAVLKAELKDGRIWIIKLLLDSGAVTGKNEACRLVDQGGVTVDDKKVENSKSDVPVTDGIILKAGKRKYFKLKLQ
ncbi:MAG: tyrosine--tRNA ligase [Candidatus Firestonebacteria bacterium]